MRYCKTKAGKVYKIWSDNVEERTLNVYPEDEHFDAESTNTTVFRYDEVEILPFHDMFN